MNYLRHPLVRRWVVPLLASAFFFWLLVFRFPYATGYGWNKVSLASLIWGIASVDSEYQYCLVVPFISLFVLYLRRNRLAVQPVQGENWALGLMLAGLLLYWLGLRSELQYLGFAGLQLLLAGTVIWFWGLAMFRAALFPWAFFAFTWPLPFLAPLIAVPLRLFMTHLSYLFLRLLHIGVIQTGTGLISAPDPARGLAIGERFQIDIADPCSGIYSLFALLMISALYGNLFLPRLWQQWVIFLSAIPLAIAGNFCRVLILTFGSIALGSKVAIGTNGEVSAFHETSGLIIFAVALACELGLGNLLIRLSPALAPRTSATT